MDVASRIRDIVVDYIGCDPKAVVAGASFIDDLGADSLDSVELVMAFEEAFGIEITSHEEGDIHTVGDVIDRVRAKTGLA